jgi:ABC-type branched-subunit amino acid transport system permease subunit
MIEMTTPDSNEISMKVVYIFVLGFLVVLVGGLITFWGAVIGAVIIIVAAVMGYMSQASGGSAKGLGLPALHRELAKTHCGQCGAPMRSNMTFCPACGAAQTPT